MKKFVAFALVMSLGLFCAVGCNKPAPKKDQEEPAATAPATTDAATESPAADAPAAGAPVEPAADEPAEPAADEPAGETN